MRFAAVFISLLLFSFCSRGKSPEGGVNTEQNGSIGNRDDVANIILSTADSGSCSFGLVTDLKRGANGIYSCNYRKTSYRYYLQNPQKRNGLVLVLLPGWNYPVMDWKTKTGVVDSALSWGFQVLLCDMGKSVYMDSIYPEAREDYKEFATRTWLWDSILGPVSRNIGNGNMVLMGLSTGARGAVLMGMEHQNEVGGVVALSGDYFPNMDANDKLMINSMGTYTQFKRRWEAGANDVRNLDGIPNLVYLAHGRQDSWVNPKHTLRLKKHLENVRTTETLEVQIAEGKHDYTFWNVYGLQGLMFMRLLDQE